MEINMTALDGSTKRFSVQQVIGTLKEHLKGHYLLTVPERNDCADKLARIERTIGSK